METATRQATSQAASGGLNRVGERAGADSVKTSSGCGFVKQADNSDNYRSAAEHDLALMRASCSPQVQVKAADGVRDLDGLIKVRNLGTTCCGATASAAILDRLGLGIELSRLRRNLKP